MLKKWVLAFGLLAACGGDDDDDTTDAPGAPDAAVGGFDPAGFDDPSDFPRVGCTPGLAADIASGALAGIWHLDTRVDLGSLVSEWNAALRLNARDDFPFYAALLDGSLTRDVRPSGDDLVIRRLTTGSSGYQSLRSLDICKRNEDGSLEGHIVSCAAQRDPACNVGTFRAVAVNGWPAGEEEASGLGYLGEFRGEELAPWPDDALPVNVRARDGVAYVVSHTDGLRTVDVSDPSAMRALGHHAIERGYNDVKLYDAGERRYALCSSDYRGVDVIDVTDPTRPTAVSNFSDSGSVHTLAIEGTRAFLPDSYYDDEAKNYLPELSVWDIADPLNPQYLGRYVLPTDPVKGGGFIHDLSVQDGIAYLNYWNRGFVWVDTKDPAAIAQLGLFDGYERRTSHSNWVTTIAGCKVAVHGDEDFGAHLRTIGVDPTCRDQLGKVLGEYQRRPEVSIHNIMAFGTTAYVAHYQDGVRLFDLSNPAEPKLSAWFNTWSGPGESFFEGAVGIDVDLDAKRIYVADIPRGLVVLAIE